MALQGLLALSAGYLVALLAGALRARRRQAGAERQSLAKAGVGAASTRFVVMIPAHDEQQGIADTLAAIEASEYPADLCHVIVVADNCSDDTAQIARQAGAEVWERSHATDRGKGHAVAWGMERLLGSPEADAFDAAVVLDADCLVSANMLATVDLAMRSGAQAAQVDYVVGNPSESSASALRFAGFSLMCTVRPLGKQGLGLSGGLFGTGMAFTTDLLRREPWTVTDFGEDFEYHLRLLHSGVRVEFLPQASVTSAMPTSFESAAVQQERWEKGKLVLMRHRSLPAVLAGLRRRDLLLLHAGLEQFVPPQSLIAAGSIGSALAALALRSRRLLACSLATLAGQALFVLGGLRLVNAPASVYRALLSAPALIAGKVAIYARLLGSKEQLEWVRTERQAPAAKRRTTPRIGYLCGQYPAISHTFVLREVLALRGRGLQIDTFSVRRAPREHLLAHVDRAEDASTFAILPPSWPRLLWAHARLALSSPRAYFSTLAYALRVAPAGLRGALWQLFYFAEAGVLWSECERRGVRHLHVHLANVAADVALLTSELGCRRDGAGSWSWSFSMHGPREFFDVSRFRLAEKVRKARFVVCISDFTRSQLMTLCEPHEWEKLHVVHCGVMVDHFSCERDQIAASEDARILCLGRLVADKGQSILLRALALLAGRGLRVHTTFAGEGAMRAELEAHARRLGIEQQVSFIGAVGEDDLKELFANATLFCLPSFAEGVPGVLMEAMAMQLPVITTPIAGIPELVENEVNGLLVPPGRPDRLADAIERLLSNPQLRRQMGFAGRQKVVREFNTERLGEQLHELFSQTLARPAAEGANAEEPRAGKGEHSAGEQALQVA